LNIDELLLNPDCVAQPEPAPSKDIISAKTRSALMGIEAKINSRLIGQKPAVSQICKAIKRKFTGFKAQSHRPVGVFFLTGASGTGKTELCKVLAEILYGDEKKLIRLDMSELSSRWDISRLTGAAPGYISHEHGGQLTNLIKANPSAILMLDEIEKAHPDVYNIFLQIFDDGRLTSSQGETVSFKDILIIATSNVGSSELSNCEKPIGFTGNKNKEIITREKIMEAMKRTFKPEFLNRLDDIIIFNKLTKKDALQISKLLLDKVKARALELGIKIEFDKSVAGEITRLGYDAENSGARELRRTVTINIEDMLADEVLMNRLHSGDEIRVVFSENNFAVEKKKSTKTKKGYGESNGN